MSNIVDISWLRAVKNLPFTRLTSPLLSEKEVELWVVRLDLVDPLISGNKWFKLKYNLLHAHQLGHTHVVSFGGAFSNHLHALSAACKQMGIKATGIVRGEIIEPLNPTLADCVSNGMTLLPVTRSQYRQKHSEGFIESLRKQLGDFYLVPEGGSNIFALRGMSEVAGMIVDRLSEFDCLCCPVGSGGTLAGLSLGVAWEASRGSQCLGFSALKGGEYIESDIEDLHRQYTEELSGAPLGNWHINHDYHFGGFAKIKPELITFIQQFEASFSIPLEPVYTAKMFYGLFDLIGRDYFKKGDRVIAVHTGGLQGRRGYDSMFGH